MYSSHYDFVWEPNKTHSYLLNSAVYAIVVLELFTLFFGYDRPKYLLICGDVFPLALSTEGVFF